MHPAEPSLAQSIEDRLPKNANAPSVMCAVRSWHRLHIPFGSFSQDASHFTFTITDVAEFYVFYLRPEYSALAVYGSDVREQTTHDAGTQICTSEIYYRDNYRQKAQMKALSRNTWNYITKTRVSSIRRDDWTVFL